MKVFNLTDVETPQLRRQGLVGVPIKVDGVIIAPGTCGEVRDTSANRKYLQQSFVGRSAIALDRVPKGYTGTAGQEKETPVTPPPVEAATLPPPPPPSPTEEPPPDTQRAPGEEDEEAKPKKKKRSSRRGS